LQSMAVVKARIRYKEKSYFDCPRVPRRRVVIWGNCWRIIYTHAHRYI